MRNAFVSGELNTPAFAMFSKWQCSCASLFDEFQAFDPPIAPFKGNETSCVSVLAAAAGRAGFTPIAEAVVKKNAQVPEGLPKEYRGRSDLMMTADGLQYAFEFKISWPDSSHEQLKLSLALAQADINCVPGGEHDHRFAAIVAPFSDEHARATYESFEPGQYAFYVSDPARRTGAFFFFQPCQGN